MQQNISSSTPSDSQPHLQVPCSGLAQVRRRCGVSEARTRHSIVVGLYLKVPAFLGVLLLHSVAVESESESVQLPRNSEVRPSQALRTERVGRKSAIASNLIRSTPNSCE